MEENTATPVAILVVEFFRLLDKAGVHPKPTSPLAVDVQRFSHPESLRTVMSYAGAILESAKDHLLALNRLVGVREEFTFAPWTCARGCLEASTRAAWLLDSSIDARERVARGLAVRYSVLVEREKLARALSDLGDVDEARRRVDEVEELAVSLGYDKFRDRNGDRFAIGTIAPATTELTERVFPGSGVLFRIMSGVSHGDARTLRSLGFYDEGPTEHGGRLARRGVPRKLLHDLLGNATQWYSRATILYVKQYGFDLEEAARIFGRWRTQWEAIDKQV